MRTVRSAENPFGPTRAGYLWERLRRRPAGRHLDFGANDGRTIATLVTSGVVRSACGVEASRDAVAGTTMPPGAELRHLAIGERLNADAETYDSASLLDVLEHVADQGFVLRELHRVLKPGGELVVTVPGRHVFSFLDTGNLKFRFAPVHRFVVQRRMGASAYSARYIESSDGLIGDIDSRKKWHQHFSYVELSSLLRAHGFQSVDRDGAGLFYRVLVAAYVALPFFRGPAYWKLVERDATRFGRAHLFVSAVKRA